MITIPTIQELYNDIKSDIENRLGVTITPGIKAFIPVFCAVQAAKLKLYYLAIGNLQKNIFVDTADQEANGGTLERFGRIKLGRDPFPAQSGIYNIEITATIGTVIKANTTFKSNDDSLNPGILYVLDQEYTTVSNPDIITVRALTSGTIGKLDIGNELTVTSPVAGMNKIATVLSVDTDPLDAEDIEEYRQKVINSYRLETQGGAATDYRIWASDAQGVAQVYPYAKSGATSEIDLYVEATVDDSVDGKGTPTAGILAEVEDVVNFNPDTTLTTNERGRRPVTAIVNYLPIVPKDIAITITGFQNLTTEKENLINDQLNSIISEIRPFVSGADILEDKNDILDTNRIISAIISVVPGAVFTSVTLEVDAVETLTYTFTDGDIPYYDINTSLTFA